MKTNIRDNPKRFLIGSDPEFMMLRNGKAAPMTGQYNDPVGYDGTGYHKICEVRVVPTECPLEMINSIRYSFLNKVKKYPQTLNYDWVAGSFKLQPIGGHLHGSTKKEDILPETANLIIGNYVGALSLAIEDKNEAVKRRNSEDGKYGFLNDYRLQPWGWEARCFSSWLTTPAVALAHICLFKTVLYETLNNKSFSPNVRFSDDDFIFANISKIRNNFHAIWKEVSQMALYPQYKEYIDIFKFLIENKLTWEPIDKTGRKLDMRETWGLADTTINSPKVKIPAKPIYLEDKNGIFA